MGASRRLLVSLLCALLLLAFAPRLVAGAGHEHADPGATTPDCAACIVGHTPGLEAAPVAVLPAAPVAVAYEDSHAPVLAPRGSFAYAAPLACGPPA